MKKNYIVFYSWQSDIAANENRNNILTCIQKAIKEIGANQDCGLGVEVSIDRDTQDTSGSPDIADTIFDKIKQSDIFICDVTIINSGTNNIRLTPNPNVLIELGFAVRALGWERIVCVNNLKYSIPDTLPFDIRKRRISSYNSDDKNKEHLKSVIKHAILSITKDYDNIISRHLESGFLRHDKNIYLNINNICSENELYDSISQPANYLFITKYYYRLWSKLVSFYEETMNQFLDEELDVSYREFVMKLENMHDLCSKKFFHDRNEGQISLLQLEGSGVEITDDIRKEHERSETYSAKKDPFPGESWSDANKRRHNLQEDLLRLGKDVIDSYRSFLLKIKLKLIIQ